MKPQLLLRLQDAHLREHFCVRPSHAVFVLRHQLLLHFRGDHVLAQLRRANLPALFLQLRVHPVMHQCLKPCWHHAAPKHQYVLATFATHRLIAPLCCAMCAVRHALQQRHCLLRCLARCERGPARFVRAQTRLLQQQASHSLALQWQDCALLRQVHRAFAQRRLQALPQHRRQSVDPDRAPWNDDAL